MNWLQELKENYKKVELVGQPIPIDKVKSSIAEFMTLTGFDCIQNVRVNGNDGYVSNIISIGCVRNRGYGNAWIFEECERQGLDPQVARDIIGFNFQMGINWGGWSTAPIGEGIF